MATEAPLNCDNAAKESAKFTGFVGANPSIVPGFIVVAASPFNAIGTVEIGGVIVSSGAFCVANTTSVGGIVGCSLLINDSISKVKIILAGEKPSSNIPRQCDVCH